MSIFCIDNNINFFNKSNMKVIELKYRVSILLIEDDPEEINTMKYILADYNDKVELRPMSTGNEVYSFIDNFSFRYRKPDLIISNMNLNGTAAYDIIGKMKTHLEFHHIPFVVLTNTEWEEDIVKCYERGAHSILTRPSNLKEYKTKIHMLLAELFSA